MLTPQVNNCFELPRSRLDEWWSFEMKRIGGGGKEAPGYSIQGRAVARKSAPGRPDAKHRNQSLPADS